MKEKEISEIRRRLRPGKNNIAYIRGCYVNEKREVISLFNQSTSVMPQEEAETFLSLFKRTLSGPPGKNLIDIAFSTGQVADSEEHRLLMSLKNSGLKDEEAVQTLYQRAIQSITLEGNYLILLAYDTYDVPYRAKDDEKLDDASSEVFSYILCSICPVKTTKPTLNYESSDREFHSRESGWAVAAPELGFLFPSFHDRSTDIYHAQFYSHDITENHTEFVDTVFHTQAPLPAAAQKEIFQTILGDALAEDCSYEVLQAVHEQLCERIEEHKANREENPLMVSKHEVKYMLESCGVSEPHVAAFEEKFDTEFGADAELSPRNVVDNKQFEIRTPDVVIHVNPDRSDLIETRIINGAKYILICADQGIEVNGVNIQFTDPQ